MKKEIKDLSKEDQKEYLLQVNIQSIGYIILMTSFACLYIFLKSNEYIIAGWIIFCLILMIWDNNKLKDLYLGD